MSERGGSMSLESMLLELASAVEYPNEPDFAAAVGERLRQGEATSPIPARTLRWPRLVLAAAVVVTVLVTAGLVLFPGARRAVADWLGISGIQIRVQEGQPNNVSPSIDASRALQLGDRVSLEVAADRVEFEPLTPRFPGLGSPDVFVSDTPTGGALSLVYPPGPRLPETKETGVGLLFTQFVADFDVTLIKKISAGASVRTVAIGDEGYWIKGSPHALLYLDAEGEVREDLVRLAGNTLIWEEGRVSYRLESALSLEEALQVARSVE